jgi:hypothetical protein
MEFNPVLGMQDTLKQAETLKLKVTLHLRRGQTLGGVVGAVADHHLVLTHLTGREFFDALVRIEDISAIEVQVRKR